MCERTGDESEMILRFLVWLTEEMEFPFTEMERLQVKQFWGR